MGKDWGQEEKGMTEDEMAGWHHWHNGHGFGWTLGVGDGQEGLACYCSWGCKESDMTERLNWTERVLKQGCDMVWCVCKPTALSPAKRTDWRKHGESWETRLLHWACPGCYAGSVLHPTPLLLFEPQPCHLVFTKVELNREHRSRLEP